MTSKSFMVLNLLGMLAANRLVRRRCPGSRGGLRQRGADRKTFEIEGLTPYRVIGMISKDNRF
ncbi:hypothetical protein [Methylocapsa aurea]|uniref:hypothetical protein n=1 Tax=Methylocapsa aurea TaxID=663610 RepID=UPI0012EB1995|nr:hypothetical protein [Methylocapsa aurea]